jgi:acyl carrier protein
METFNPMMDIPYYYPCNFPLIHEVLLKQNSLSSLSLLANARMYGLPACSSEGLMKTYFDKLGYKEAVWLLKGKTELAGFEEGLALARDVTGRGELLLTTGTSYYLPYCDDYLNPLYIDKLVDPHSRLYLVDHWLAVYEIGKEHVMVYDPVPARYNGALPLSTFHDYWKGNKCIPELAHAKRREQIHSYCTVAIEPEARLSNPADYEQALLRVLLTEVHEFLTGREIVRDGRTYFFGHAVSLRLQQQLETGLLHEPAAFNGLSGFLFDMRWSRYFFRDLLYDLSRLPAFSPMAYTAEYDEIIKSWERAHKLLVSSGLPYREQAQANWIKEYVGELVRREYGFYERLQAQLGGMAPLLEGTAAAEDGKAHPSRSDLTRIVLDSCREVTRTYATNVPGQLNGATPLYGRDGYLDSLGLVSLLAVVEQSIEDQLGARIELTEHAGQRLNDNPFRTVDSLVGYLAEHLEEAG